MSTAGELIRKARYELYDTAVIEYSDEELLHYLADAVSHLTRVLVSACSSYNVRESFVVVSPIPLPEKFLALAEYEPERVRIVGSEIYCKRLPATLRYYIEYSRPDSADFIMDVPQAFESVLSRMVTARALNRNEYSTALEQQYIQTYTAEIVRIARQRDGLIVNAERKVKYEL